MCAQALHELLQHAGEGMLSCAHLQAELLNLSLSLCGCCCSCCQTLLDLRRGRQTHTHTHTHTRARARVRVQHRGFSLAGLWSET